MPNDKLQDLHDLLAQELLDRLQNGEETVVGEEVRKVDAKPSTLNVIRQFLKDNGIEANPTPKSPLGRLADALPSFDEDGEASHPEA